MSTQTMLQAPEYCSLYLLSGLIVKLSENSIFSTEISTKPEGWVGLSMEFYLP